MKPGPQELGVKQGKAAAGCSTPDLQVEFTKDAQLQPQQVLPELCRCSFFLEGSKGREYYSSQHDYHLLLLRFLSSLQSYQLTIHHSTVNAK